MQYAKLENTDIEGRHLAQAGWTNESSRENDIQIIERDSQIAQKKRATMSAVALAWLYAKRTTTLMMPLGQWICN